MKIALLLFLAWGTLGHAFIVDRVSINQYFCTSYLYEDVIRKSYVIDLPYPVPYYYREKHVPSAILNPGLVCHDQFVYGTSDNTIFPRSNLRKGVFTLWNLDSYWFFPVDTNDQATLLSKQIAYELEKNGIKADAAQFNSLFEKLNWQIGAGPDLKGERDDLGIYLRPFIDPKTSLSYCPSTKNRRLAKNPLARMLTPFLEGDTEGIYLAKGHLKNTAHPNGSAETVVNQNDQFLLLNESTFKKVWFYIDGSGNKIVPQSENEAAAHQLYFFWPANTLNPLVYSSGQTLYTVYHPSELSNSTLKGTVIPHDKKFGCIPSAN